MHVRNIIWFFSLLFQFYLQSEMDRTWFWFAAKMKYRLEGIFLLHSNCGVDFLTHWYYKTIHWEHFNVILKNQKHKQNIPIWWNNTPLDWRKKEKPTSTLKAFQMIHFTIHSLSIVEHECDIITSSRLQQNNIVSSRSNDKLYSLCRNQYAKAKLATEFDSKLTLINIWNYRLTKLTHNQNKETL